MFLTDRESALAAIKALGARACDYCCDPELWPDGQMCDCKYGVRADSSLMGEQTGCPELRSIYVLVREMTDAEWAILTRRYLRRRVCLYSGSVSNYVGHGEDASSPHIACGTEDCCGDC